MKPQRTALHRVRENLYVPSATRRENVLVLEAQQCRASFRVIGAPKVCGIGPAVSGCSPSVAGRFMSRQNLAGWKELRSRMEYAAQENQPVHHPRKGNGMSKKIRRSDNLSERRCLCLLRSIRTAEPDQVI